MLLYIKFAPLTIELANMVWYLSRVQMVIKFCVYISIMLARNCKRC